VLDVLLRPALREVAVDVAHDLAHPPDVLLAEVRRPRAAQLDDVAAHLVPDGLAVAVPVPAHRPRLLGLEPALELAVRHVHAALEPSRTSRSSSASTLIGA
jgi:hypothetical protein